MMQPDHLRSQSGKNGAPQQVALLTERAQNGDRAAFEQLVDLFHEEIFRMVYYRTRSRMDAEDLTQDIFLLVYKNLSRLKDIDRFRPWIFSIAVNRVRDFHRRRRILTFFSLSGGGEDDEDTADREIEDDPGVLEQLMNHEFWEQVKQLSEKLSPVEREVFFLRFMDHLSIKEISEVLSKSESAVKTHLYRSLKKFKEDSAFLQMLRGDVS
jgi:RNA polymerase sigma-70 factor (ECF subfamily)